MHECLDAQAVRHRAAPFAARDPFAFATFPVSHTPCLVNLVVDQQLAQHLHRSSKAAVLTHRQRELSSLARSLADRNGPADFPARDFITGLHLRGHLHLAFPFNRRSKPAAEEEEACLPTCVASARRGRFPSRSPPPLTLPLLYRVQMASTAAGVAVGSTMGHGLSSMLFGGGAAQQAPAAPVEQQSFEERKMGGSCEIQAKGECVSFPLRRTPPAAQQLCALPSQISLSA